MGGGADITKTTTAKKEKKKNRNRNRSQDTPPNPLALVGRSVAKSFLGHPGVFPGKVVAYDASRRFFQIAYDDGDHEELELCELQQILVDRAESGKRRGEGGRKDLEIVAKRSKVAADNGANCSLTRHHRQNQKAEPGTDGGCKRRGGQNATAKRSKVADDGTDGDASGQQQRNKKAESKSRSKKKDRNAAGKGSKVVDDGADCNTFAQQQKENSDSDIGQEAIAKCPKVVDHGTDCNAVGQGSKRRSRNAVSKRSKVVGNDADCNSTGKPQKETNEECRKVSLSEVVPIKNKKEEGSSPKRPKTRQSLSQSNAVTPKPDESMDIESAKKSVNSKLSRSKSPKPETLDGGTVKGHAKSGRRDLKTPKSAAMNEQDSEKQRKSARRGKRKRQDEVSLDEEATASNSKRKKGRSLVTGPIANHRKASRTSQICSNSDESEADESLDEQSRWFDQESSEDECLSEPFSTTDNESSEYDCQEHVSSSDSDVSDKGIGEFELSPLTESANLPPVLPLPPSSQDIPIPEVFVPVLFSVYSFLRSFSRMLFLSPFRLEDFIAAISVEAENELVDSVHLSLLQVLRRHFDRVVCQGSLAAEQCVRMLDWNLLDSVTWVPYLVAFLATHSFHKVYEVGGNLYEELHAGNYFKLAVGHKLFMLGFLCDHVMDTEEARMELDIREDRYNNSQGTKEEENAVTAAVQVSVNDIKNAAKSSEDGNSDECVLCGMGGNLICCDGCPAAYHVRCLGISRGSIPPGDWFCPECIVKKYDKDRSYCFEGLRGAELLGIDAYGRSFMATCGHLLVLEYVTMSDVGYKYYAKQDIIEVLEALDGLRPFCECIQKAIACYWNIANWGKPVDNGPAVPCELDSMALGKAKEEDPSLASDNANLQNDLAPCEQALDQAKTEIPPSNGITPSMSLYSQVLPCDSTLNSQQASGVTVPEPPRSDQFPKPDFYINHYHLGDVAATAAANLMLVTRGEGGHSSLDDKVLRRKKKSTSIAEQLKAFSRAPARFYWPNLKRKQMELPREKCGWCYTCINPTAKRGCLLNQVALTLAAGAGCVLGGIRPTKSGSGHLHEVAGYLLFMEENLHSLLGGPWESVPYRKIWRKRVEQATSVRQVKYCLLQLEANLRAVVLLDNWFKQCKDAPLLSPRVFITSSEAFTVSRKGSGSRSSRKGSHRRKASNIRFVQWSARRGKLTRRMLDWHTLPCAVARVAGRQGGLKKIPNLCLTEVQEVAIRSRRCAWIARVESAASVSDLAIQVRILDAHIRWHELSSDGLGLAASPNAYIHGKDLKNGALMYLIDSSLHSQICQKQSISKYQGELCAGDAEGVTAENKLIWVRESEVLLSLLRTFEERNRAANQNKHSKLAIHQTYWPRVQKVAKEKIFDFLLAKNRTVSSWICKVCKMQVSFKNGVQCDGCQVVCHVGCSRRACLADRSEKFLCYLCEPNRVMKQPSKPPLEVSTFAPNEIQNTIGSKKKKPSSLTHPENPALATQTVLNCLKQMVSIDKDSGSYYKQVQVPDSACVPSSLTCRGPNNSYSEEDSLERRPWMPKLPVRRKPDRWLFEGIDFRKSADDHRRLGQEHVHGIGLTYANYSPTVAVPCPTCYLCKEPFNAELLYIRCQFCPLWFHGEAIGVTGSNLPKVAVFKCHKCRKKGTPTCPYSNNKNAIGEVGSQLLEHNIQTDNLSSSEGMHVFKSGIENSPGDVINLPHSLSHGKPHIHNRLNPFFQQNQFKPAAADHNVYRSDMNNQGSQPYTSLEKADFLVASSKVEETPISCESFDYKQQPLKLKMASSVGSLDLMEDMSEIEEATASSRDLMQFRDQYGFLEVGFNCKQEFSPDPIEEATIDIQDISGNEILGFNIDEIPEEVSPNLLVNEGDDTAWVDENSRDLFTFSELLSCGKDPVIEAQGDDMGGAGDVSEKWSEAAPGNLYSGYSCAESGNCYQFETDMQGNMCAICFDGTAPDLQCCGCGVSVHRQCYDWAPVDHHSEEVWMCDACKGGVEQGTCCLCPFRGGALKLTAGGLWIHAVCALGTPGLFAGPSGLVDNLNGIPKSRKNRRCFVCRLQVGVVVTCSKKGCKIGLHPFCGRRALGLSSPLSSRGPNPRVLCHLHAHN